MSPAKKDINNKDIRDANYVHDDDDDDEESMDWWTKYFASLDKMMMGTIIFLSMQLNALYIY